MNLFALRGDTSKPDTKKLKWRLAVDELQSFDISTQILDKHSVREHSK